MVRVSPEREADTDTVRVSRVMADMEAADTEEGKILCPGSCKYTGSAMGIGAFLVVKKKQDGALYESSFIFLLIFLLSSYR